MAISDLRQLLVKRSHGAAHAATLLSAAGALVGFAAQNAALEQGELLMSRRDLVAPKSLLMFAGPKGERFLLGSWINGPLLMGYGHAFPLVAFVAKAAGAAGLKAADFPNITTIERRVATAIREPGFGAVPAPPGHKLAAQPRDLLRSLWPRARRILTAPVPIQLADEPALDEAHWPILLSVVAGMLVTLTKDVLPPAHALALVMESALVGSRLDPEADRSGPLAPRARSERPATRQGREVPPGGLERPGVRPHGRRLRQLGRRPAQHRMPPAGGDLGERTHDEQPLISTGMRQGQAGGIDHLPAVGDEVEIDAAHSRRPCPGQTPLRWQKAPSARRPGRTFASTSATPLRYSGPFGSGQAAELHQPDLARTGNSAWENRARAASSNASEEANSPARLLPSATTTASSSSPPVIPAFGNFETDDLLPHGPAGAFH